MNKQAQISVLVQPQYIANQSKPNDSHYVFSYTVTIKNTGNIAAKLLTRHWIITDSDGKKEEVRGPGVIGEYPHLAPGQSYRYTSGSILNTPVGTMQGSYQMRTDDGEDFDAQIPLFRLAAVQLH